MNNMSSLEIRSSSTNGEMEFTLCAFCSNSTNGFEKRLFATDQPKGPFFPVLAELQGTKTKLDLLGRAVVCVACFHHLLRQWSSFERRGIPVRKREYNIITDDCVNNYQAKREVEIRKEAEHKIKEIQDREERIRQEAEQRFEKYRQRQAEIRREAEKRLLEEQTLAEKLKQETATKLKEEQQREEELRRKAEERIQEEKEKREYIRQEAQRLLREEKLLDSERTKQGSQPVNKQEDQIFSPEVVTTYRTEVIIPSVQSVKESSPLIEETTDQLKSDDMDKGAITEKETTARSKSRKMMVFDPETGCYRKKSDVEDDDENVVSAMKTERVEYRFQLRSDDTSGKATETEDSYSKPDKASEDIQVSMGSEPSFAMNGKNRSRSEDRDEDDLKNAGDIMKAKFEEDRKKFEQEPYERKRSDSSKQRTARQTSDDSLEEKIREMERRRERLLLKGPSMELEKKRRSSDDTKDLSPKDEPTSSGDRAKSPDDNTKKQRSRSERNKRRLTAEELSLKKSSSEEDAPEGSWRSSDTAKVLKTETKKETFTIQLKRTEKLDDEVFMTQVKPVEAGSGDLMSWDDDFTDGRKTVPEEVPPPVFRKRADSMEGETFPKPLKLVEIETPITVIQKGNVESAPVATRNILDLDESSNMSSAPVIDSISNWDNQARAGNSADEERRRREKEHQERKRRIEENQRRGAKELKTKRQSGSDFNENQKYEEPVREMTMTEKRRSLVDLWESFSEPQTNVISFGETEDKPPQRSKKILVRENRTISFDPTEDDGKADEMEVDDEEPFSSSRPVPAVRNKKLSEEEQKWESAGNFQPGQLQKTVFHSKSETTPAVEEPKAKPRKATSRYDWMKGESFADQEALVPTKLKVDVQNQTADDKPRINQANESVPKPVPRQTETKPTRHDSQSSSDDSESESEEERKPRIDTDDYHKLTEDEKQWESAGHFQPKKLNNALMASFLQADSGDIKPMPKKTQERPRDLPKTSPEQKVSTPSQAQKNTIQIEQISPALEVKTETEPYTPGTYVYEDASSDDDDIPGWRKVEEKRRKQEREELERAQLEEKQRMEREVMEEDVQEDTYSSDDEFEAKVRTKEIRRINPNLFSQFSKELEKEPEKPVKLTKPIEQTIAVSNVQLIESTPSFDITTEELSREQNQESSDDDDDIPGWRKVEENRRKQEQEEIERAKLEEKQRIEREAMDENVQEDTDSSDDEFEAKVRTKEIRRINPNLFSQFSKEPDKEPEKPVKSTKPKEQKIAVSNVQLIESKPSFDITTEELSRERNQESSDDDDDIPGWRKVEEKRRKQEQEEIERAKLEEQRRMEREAIEENDQKDTDSSDDEFEAKVRTQEIRRINPNLLCQFMKELDKEPEKTVKSSKPKEQTIEVANVQLIESTPSFDNFTEGESLARSVEDEYEEKVKSGQVRKLKLDNNTFLQTKEEDHVHRDVPRGSRVVIEEELYVQNVERTIVESVPSRDEGKGYTNEPKINTYRTSTQESSDDESEEDGDVPAWRKMEEKRRRQEQEEIERAKLEEQRRLEREASESKENVDADSVDDDEFDAKVRTKEIRKINPNLLIQFIGESGDKATPPSTRRPQKETIEIQRVQSTETSSSEDSDVEDIKVKGGDDDDEYELKVKSGQVKKLVLGDSPFAQTTIKEEPKVVKRRPEAIKRSPEPKQDSRTAVVQEEVLVQMTDAKVVESEPDLVFHEPKEDDEYEEKVKSRFVKKLSQDQFVFLRKQEEEQRKKAQEEERRRAEWEERERLKKEEERRMRLEAEVRAKEEERMRREEEIRRREEDERIQKEEEKRRKLEEAERVRQEENERIRREEEEERTRFEQMRRQKQEAKKKFESGVFDGIAINYTEKDIYSVGRLDSNKFLQFQQSSQEEPKLKTKTRDKEKKVVEECKVLVPEAETVVMESVDLNESSPYDDAFETLQSEDLEYEEKRKSVGKLDKDWYIKQQWKQVEEHDRRARELEDQRLREERNEMLRDKEVTSSKQWEEDEPSVETRDRSDSEKIRSKLSVDKFKLFEQESRQEPKKSRKKKQKEETIKVEKRDEVQAAPVFFEGSRENVKRKSTSSEDGSVAILAWDEGDAAQRKMRLQREGEETELLCREEEKRRLAYEEESYRDERESDKPKNVGKLNQEQFTLFQQERQVELKAKTRKQAPQKVQDVVSVQRQEDVESVPISMYQAEGGPSVTQEDAEYEQRINTGKRLDVDRYLNSRAQEADEKRQREKNVAEERKRQEQDEMARLRAEEKKRLKRMQEELDEGYVEESTTPTTDFERSRKISIERRASTPEELEPERTAKGVSVGRLPKDLRSTFKGERSKADGADSRRKSNKSKGSISQSTVESQSRSSRSSSNDSLSYVLQDRSVNGSVSPRERGNLEGKSDRRDSSNEIQDEGILIKSGTPEEKPVPKKLNRGMLTVFQKSEGEPEVQLRRAKSEKSARPKSIGNVDLLRWQDDSILRQSSSDTSKKEKTRRQPRPKSLAY